MTSRLTNPDAGGLPRRRDPVPGSVVAGDQPAPVLAPLLRALSQDPSPAELRGFEDALASFRSAVPARRPAPHTIWRIPMLASLAGTRLVSSLAGIAVAAGATAVVISAGGLTSAPHQPVHPSVGGPGAQTTTAPVVTPKPSETGEAVGPDAKGPAAFGLCNAWSRHQANGAKPTGSVAFRNLATAAGGEGKIATYCATIAHPGKGNHPSGKGTGKPNEKPDKPGKTRGDDDETGKPTGKGTGRPTDKPTGAATGKPSGSGTGKPTTLPTPTTTSTLPTIG